jgi:hypothetical protein
VDSGPCIDCEQTAAKPTHLPPSFGKLLHHEFSLLSDMQLHTRLAKLNLPVSGQRSDLVSFFFFLFFSLFLTASQIERLVQYVLAEEQSKL